MAEVPKTKESAQVQFWLDQLGDYKQEFQDWEKKCKKIIRRYRDERDEKSDGTPTAAFRFNALWSNVQTLQPAIYIKPPKPVAERRFLDKDTLARYASMTLERALDVQIEVGYLHPSMQRAVLDYLLCGRGSVWERYEPTYGDPINPGPHSEEMEEGGVGESADANDTDEPAKTAVRPVTYEKVCTDFVAYNKFRHSPASVWEDVWWVAKEEMLTRDELRARFSEVDKATGKKIADLIPLQKADNDQDRDDAKRKRLPRACIWEIWDKSKRQVVFIAPDWPNAPVEVRDDPLNLDGFWPCPKPLYATTTNDTLVPVPDYVEYQDQADELDNITSRIKALTDAIRVNGVYDASYPELKRILQEGVDNRLIGVKNYAEFASKGGLESAIDFIPIKDVVEALIRLYEARDRVKADMAEITGISDIIRGQAQGQAKTATEQRIKGQFASLRLEDRKKDVARFCCDTIRIAGEIISEHFSPEILAEMTGMLPFIATEVEDELQAAQALQAQQAQQAPAGVSPPPAAGAPGAPPSSGAGMLPVDQLTNQKFQEVCELLRNDKMRTFRIDIETDSTIEVDKQAEKESVVELFTALGGMLEKSMAVGQMAPELVPALGQSLLFAFRRFGAGRDVEGAWENAVDQMIRKAKNPAPKQPSPEEIKAQAEQQKQQMETQRMQQEAALEERRGQQEMALEQKKAQMELQQKAMELQFKERELELKERELNMTMAAKQQENALNQQAKERDAAIDEADSIRKAEIEERADVRSEQMAERAAERDAEAGERKFKLDQKVMEAKAKQAARPKEKA